MGEATPAQPAAGGFVPMLGVGMVGPGGVSGSIATSRGSAVPQLHSAIVERLRARIELCRRHHSTCENRYQRGQAENSDREHETTLHLLNIVHQGPGNRKAKGSRASNQQPAEYSRINGEPKGQGSTGGGQKISTRIALQGSLRRKLESQVAPGYPSTKQNGLSCGPSDFKRVRMEGGGGGGGGGLGHGGCGGFGPGHAPPAPPPQGGKSYMMPHGVGSDLFHLTLKEMKKEPAEARSCGQHGAADMMVFDFKDEPGGPIDPDLQDLFDELTKSVPSLNDLELEKMLKQDDAFGLDLGHRPGSAGAAVAAGNLCPPMDKPIKTEYSPPHYGQSHCGGSPQLRPASAGPSFSMGGSSPAVVAPPAQKGRGLAGWPEVSHAEQLKQMAAANQQQPGSLHHHQQTAGGGGAGGWAPAMSGHSSGGSFAHQDKLAGQAAPPGQQRISPQGAVLPPPGPKSAGNCVFRPNGHNGSGHMDMKVLGNKPILHFSPKVALSAGKPMPAAAVAAGPPNKTAVSRQQQQQPSGVAQSQTHPAHHYQNPQMAMSGGGPCLQAKPLSQRAPLNQHGPGLHFKLAQHQRQGMAAGPRLPTNGSLGGMGGQRAPGPVGPQKAAGKTLAMQRQLAQQQHGINDADKDGAQDQFSRHLTRPPPDYKQTRNMAAAAQPGLFTGMSSSQSLPSSMADGDLQSLPCHLPAGPGAKMAAASVDRRYAGGPDPHPGPCVGQLQQHNNQHRMGLNQNQNQNQNQSKPRFPGPGVQSGAFVMGGGGGGGVQHARTSVGQQASGLSGPGLGGMMTSNNMGWAPGSKQAAVGPGLGVRRLPASLQSQGGQLDMVGHHYQQRHVGPPNQVAPDIGMLPLNPAVRGSAPRSSQPMMPPLPGVATLNQASPEQRVPAGSFPPPGPNSSSAYQSQRANRLTFDFLQEDDNTVPGINTDSDFIDSLLKSGSGNDDWMKDINLDEILGSNN